MLKRILRFPFPVSRFTWLLSLCLILMGSGTGNAQGVVKVDSRQDWEKWRFPKGVLRIGDDGWIRLTEMRKHINASLNAGEFTWTYKGTERTGGATAGSNAQDARYIMDGDSTTSWSPDAGASDADRWIILDLGRISLADTLRMVFDRTLDPFSDFQVYATDGIPIIGTKMMEYKLVWMTRSPYEEYVFEHVFEPDPNLSASAVQCIKIFFPNSSKGDVRSGLSELAIHTLGDNVLLNTVERGGSIVSGSTQASATRLFDGNLFDFWISPLYGTNWNDGESTRSAGAWFRLDLGATFWLDTFEFLQISDERIGGGATDVNGFKMYTSDGTPASEKGNVACWQPDGRDVIWEFLADVRNTDVPPKLGFELTCEPRPVRYIFYHHFYGAGTYRSRSNTGGKLFEFLAYGQGGVPGVTMTSNILDMGARKNITSVSWDGDFPIGTKLQLRTRTGDRTEEVIHWFHIDGTEVDEAVYVRLPSFLKGRIETELAPVDSLWSDWSAPYPVSGAPFASPSPRQYLLCEVLLQSNDPAAAPALDALMFHYTAPSASELAGEIGPWKEVAPASPQAFSCYIKSVWASGCSGYDRVLLVSPSPARGTAVWQQNASDLTWVGEDGATLRSSGDSLFVDFSRVLRSDVVKVDFETTIFYNGSPFTAFVGHSSTPWAWQRVDAGNATDEVAGSSMRVLLTSLPGRGDLIGNVFIEPDVITPNGDGVNDRMDLAFSVFKVDRDRRVTARIYDVGGIPVRRIGDWRGASRNYEAIWDGRDEEGDLVSPGLYLLRIEVDGDAGDKTVSKVVSVVY
ncbi:MAG: hypothetical protein KAJ81_00055 [Candidatus Latescibacteria bacterium]|nr:hypothetical protein [Candidatus Latescibacterota bacterium]